MVLVAVEVLITCACIALDQLFPSLVCTQPFSSLLAHNPSPPGACAQLFSSLVLLAIILLCLQQRWDWSGGAREDDLIDEMDWVMNR